MNHKPPSHEYLYSMDEFNYMWICDGSEIESSIVSSVKHVFMYTIM